MAQAELLRPLGAHARLARRVCGAGACARRRACRAPLPHRPQCRLAAPRPGEARSHQVTDTVQAGALNAAHAACRAATRRGAADPGARGRPASAAASSRRRRQHAGDHRHRS